MNLQTLTATELAQQIRIGQLSAAEAVENQIQQIERVNPKLNAVVVQLFEEARQEARQADEAMARGEATGPLHGVPVTIKECFHVRGTCSCAGIETHCTHIAEADGPLVARLRAAGAIILGKTNVPQLMMYYETDNPVYGRTNNPWNLDRTPGGSSGGEAAIIAAGGSPLGLGSDIGGSLRVPAHFTGICSLKPTSRRLSFKGSADELLFPGMEGIIDAPGPMARSVADLSLAMSVLAAPGLEVSDPSVAPAQWPDPAGVQVKGLRVGIYEDDGFLTPSPAVRRAVREAAGALEAAGAVVDRFAPPDVAEAVGLFTGILSADGATWVRQILKGSRKDKRIYGLALTAAIPGPLRRGLAGVLDAAGQRYLASSLRSVGGGAGDRQLIVKRNRYRDRFLAAMDRFDVLLCPPFVTPALTHGATEILNSFGSYATLFNLLGLPAGVVPVTRVRPGEESDRPASGDLVLKTLRKVEAGSAGLPVGVQVVARHWREDMALAAMQAIEERVRGGADYPRLG